MFRRNIFTALFSLQYCFLPLYGFVFAVILVLENLLLQGFVFVVVSPENIRVLQGFVFAVNPCFRKPVIARRLFLR